jgi:4-hydroxybenzoate polyprenyltransferase
VLGVCLGIAPCGAWVAVRGVSNGRGCAGAGRYVLGAGFDVIYATLDDEFDRKAGIYSLVQKWGIPIVARGALLSRVFVALLVGFGLAVNAWSNANATGSVAGKTELGFSILAVRTDRLFLLYEHALVKRAICAVSTPRFYS